MSELPVFYYQGGRVTWGEYLAAEQQGRTANALQKLARESATHRAAVETAMRRQGDQMAASSAALATTLARGLAEVTGKIDSLQAPLEHIGDSIDSLHADYLLGTSLLLNQVRLVGQRLESIGGLLGSIDSRLADWDQNTALAKQRKGLECLQRGLWPEALDAFKASVAHDPLNYHVQYLLGLLYLEGRDSTCDLVNLPEAVRCFELAIRYAQDLAAGDPEAKQHARLAHFHAAVAHFALANDKRLEGRTGEARESLQASLTHVHGALQYSPRFSLALYQGAKSAAALGEVGELLSLLRRAGETSPLYFRKCLADPDFHPFSGQIQDALTRYHEELKASCRELMAALGPTAEQAEAWQHAVAEGLRHAIDEADAVLARDDLGRTQSTAAKLRAWQDGTAATRVADTIRAEHETLKGLAEEARGVLSKLSLQQAGDNECSKAIEAAITGALGEFRARVDLQHAKSSLQNALAAGRARLAAMEAQIAADQQRIAEAEAEKAQREALRTEQRRLRFGRVADSTMIAVPLLIPGLFIVSLLLGLLGLQRPIMYYYHFLQRFSLDGSLFRVIAPPASVLLASMMALSIRARAEQGAWKRFPAIFKRCTIGPLKVMLSYLAASLIVGAIFLVIALILWLAGRESGFFNTWLKFGFWGAYFIAYVFAWRRSFHLQRGVS